MKVVLIEDEQYIRKIIHSYILEMDKGLDIIAECATIADAVPVIKACNPDLVFLDIHLSDGNAFEFLNQLDDLNFKIIFVTAYEEFALQALKKGAVDYIVKPIDPNELEEAVDKVIELTAHTSKNTIKAIENEFKKGQDSLVLSLWDGFQVIRLSELEFCKSDKGYTNFFLSDGRSFLASGSLKEYEERLPNNLFFRVHKSYIVNLGFIDKYNREGFIITKSGNEIPVSQRKKDGFMAVFMN